MMDGQQFCLKWDGFPTSVTSVFDALRLSDELLDVTLCCEGQQLRAHRLLLSACSPYFRDVLKNQRCQDLVIFLKDTSAADLKAIVEFIYKGSVNVAQSQLAGFIKTAETLQIRGLSGDEDKGNGASPQRRPAHSGPAVNESTSSRRATSPAPSPAKRRRNSGGSGSQSSWSPAFTQEMETTGGAEVPGVNSAGGVTPSAAQDGGRTPGVASAAPETDSAVRHQRVHHSTASTVKVEKYEVDLTEEVDDMEDGDRSMDASLAHLAAFDGAYVYDDSSQPPYDPNQHAAMSMPGTSRLTTDDGSNSGGSKFVCQFCGASYSEKYSLTKHLRSHRGETSCHICGKTYSMVYHLRRHVLSKHSKKRGHRSSSSQKMP